MANYNGWSDDTGEEDEEWLEEQERYSDIPTRILNDRYEEDE